MKRCFYYAIISLLVIQSVSFAQDGPINLSGRHSIFIDGGFKTNSTTSVIISSGTVETNTGFVGSINYSYWFENEWAMTFSAGVFGASTSTKFNGVETSGIVPLLFGVRYYPEKLSLGSKGRFYAGLSLGQYIGFATQAIKTESIFGAQAETISESVFGGTADLGIDVFVASWFKIGPKLSYHFLSDYNKIIGTRKNLSGTSFAIEFGFVL